MLTHTDIAETDYDEYNPATTYGDGDNVMETAVGIHHNYESLQAGNVGHTLTDTAWWLDLGATNRWQVFDAKTGSQTTATGASMHYDLTPAEVIDAIALLNLDATSVQIVGVDPVAGEIYNESYNLVTTVAVLDWYMYWFEPIIRATDLVKTDLATIGIPPYTDAVWTITITNTDSIAACGEIVVGLQATLGALEYGAEAGIVDYSTKTADAYGNFTITERAYSKRNSYDVTVFNTAVNEVFRLLSVYRATALVWVGHEDYTMFIVYGFYKDFRIGMRYPAYSIMTIDIEGLT